MTQEFQPLTDRERWIILLLIGGLFTACGLCADFVEKVFGQ